MNYKETINLPRTHFPMKAHLKQREPEMLRRWDAMDLYGRIREERRNAPRFTLHDGPPYASGELHIGTGMNKILKDIIVKYKTMRGFNAPYIPGWDCHGLPIEHRVMQDLGEEAVRMEKWEIRRRCERFAERHIRGGNKQFKALGVFGRWERPYLTLDPRYEAGVIDVFQTLLAKGHVYRKLRPIHWCMSCETALAEAEMEYRDHDSPSIYVRFPLVDPVTDLYPDAPEETDILIWTTTPWTLLANVAVALGPEIQYALVRYEFDGEARFGILAKNLVERVMAKVHARHPHILGVVRGRDLEGKRYRHPFYERISPIILADYVSLEDGTGAVHTAPGHGDEDYQSGLQYDLPILSPVDRKGRFTQDAGEFAGLEVFEANPSILDKLRNDGYLLKDEKIDHSYPHCWRCKNPVIFRATEQWFISVDHAGLRDRALEEIRKVQWIPDWGEIRITAMLRERPDWCISRQRAWGIPIPAFYCSGCGRVLMTPGSVEKVKNYFREHGANSWFFKKPEDILGEPPRCEACGGGEFRKENDIFDVWFESGSSWRSVVVEEDELEHPADLYLEGSDQHRGWFQLSLLPAVGTTGKAPYKTVLTHGFVVDEKGEKMSKSLGNFISVEDGVKTFGGDILRLWFSSVDYRGDISVSKALIVRMEDTYRKIRNTFRYLLGNLRDYPGLKPGEDGCRLLEIDRWALHELQRLVRDVTVAYEAYRFHRVYSLIHNFCVVEMSSFYFDIVRDRLYCSAAEAPERRGAQFVMTEVLRVLVRLLAPILVHTAEEVWGEIPDRAEDCESVHLSAWPEVRAEYLDEGLGEKWERIITVRSDILREIEKKRKVKEIGNPLEARVEVGATKPKLREFLAEIEPDLPTILIVSEAVLTDAPMDGGAVGEAYPDLWIRIRRSPHPKCARCWNLRATVGAANDHPTLCRRCLEVVRAMGD
jgi:isoleucyl-tRNA synthetase